MIYQAHDLVPLKARFKELPAEAQRIMVNAINTAAPTIHDKAISKMMDRVQLKRPYIQKHLRVKRLATLDRPRATIEGNTRETLLSRYPHQKTSKGISVAVNAGANPTNIFGAFIVKNLRGSGATGIAVKLKDAPKVAPRTKAAKRAMRYKGNTSKSAKRALNKPFILHARSINQLFNTIKDELVPDINMELYANISRQLK